MPVSVVNFTRKKVVVNRIKNSTYSDAAETFMVDFLQELLNLAPSDAIHLGGGDNPDGVLQRSGTPFSTVEVHLQMNPFPDEERKRGSGWPDIMDELNSHPNIALAAGQGTWVLHMEPDRGKIRRILTDDQCRIDLTSQIAMLMQDAPTEDIEFFKEKYGELSYLGDSADECFLGVRHQTRGGFFISSADHVPVYLRACIEEMSISSATRSSFIEKWTSMARRWNVDQIHVAFIYEGQDKWVDQGLHFQLFGDPKDYAWGPVDLIGLPEMDWTFWIVVRDPNNDDLVRAISYKDENWTIHIDPDYVRRRAAHLDPVIPWPEDD